MGCRPIILGLAIALVMSGPDDATAYETRGSRPPVVFGFTDKTGTRVLAEWPEFTPPLDPRTLTTALCSAGRRVTVSFVTYQSAREGDSGRQVAENFDRAQGSVYRIVDGKVPPDVTCIVFGASFLSTRRIAGVSVAGMVQCDASRVQRIGAERSRPVARCSRLAMLEGADELLLVEFQPKGSDLLATLVLVTSRGLTFNDFPAKCEAGSSCWREGDGGVINARDFHLVGAFRISTGYEFAIAWDRPEGQSTILIESGVFRERADWYRYWAR
ncbi:MAG: hypothetical protein DMD99_15735 [Candidatus Rokuibacteriota bacterium]|nr:MAG: hypothetical protein DMD99_15735 [Candidatus Rokubacteria bacterium]